MKVTDWIVAIATVVLAIVTSLLARYTYRLWRITSDMVSKADIAAGKQLDMMRDQLNAMAGQQAAIERQVVAMERQEKLTGDSVDQMRRAADAATAGAAAAKASADAAKESADSYKASERAWVSWSAFVATSFESSEGATGTMFTIVWLNAGRTPAIHCRMANTHKVLFPPYGKDVPSFSLQPSQRETILIPGTPGSSAPSLIMQADVEKLVARQCRIFLYGRAEYGLVFPRDSGLDAIPRTEVCVEVEYFGNNAQTGQSIFHFIPTGAQNSAT